MNRMNTSMIAMTACVLGLAATNLSSAVPPASAAAPLVEEVAARPRSANGRTTVRRYRSYSIQPGPVEGDAGSRVVEGPAFETRPNPAPAGAGRGSKPSYMRSDSKARGRFHQ